MINLHEQHKPTRILRRLNSFLNSGLELIARRVLDIRGGYDVVCLR